MAEIYTAMYVNSFGLDIKISGFNDSLKQWMEEIIEKLISFDPTQDEEKFQIIHNQLKMSYQNIPKDQPYIISNHNLAVTLRNVGMFEIEECFNTVSQLKFSDFIELTKKWLKFVRFEWLAIGNIDSSSIRDLVTFVENKLKSKGSLILTKENSTQVRIIKLRKKCHYFYDYMIPEQKQNNSDVCIQFQSERRPNSKILCMLLQNYMDVPFFTELRTKQQIGYIVDVYHEDMRGINSINFAIQAERFPSHDIGCKIMDFIDSLREKIVKLEEEEFQTYKNSVLNKINVKDINLAKEVERYWFEIVSHQLLFDRKEKESEILANITKKEFIQFAVNILWEKPRILEIHSVCEKHSKENKLLMEERKKKNVLMHEIDTLKSFKSLMKLYPDFFSFFQENFY